MTERGGSWLEPPEDYCDFVVVTAPTKRAAVIAALKTVEFEEWRKSSRGDGINPFAGVKAMLARCEHGVCWGCQSTEESSGCAQCDADIADELARLEAEIGS